jgi:hypothetical protein
MPPRLSRKRREVYPPSRSPRGKRTRFDAQRLLREVSFCYLTTIHQQDRLASSISIGYETKSERSIRLMRTRTPHKIRLAPLFAFPDRSRIIKETPVKHGSLPIGAGFSPLFRQASVRNAARGFDVRDRTSSCRNCRLLPVDLYPLAPLASAVQPVLSHFSLGNEGGHF